MGDQVEYGRVEVAVSNLGGIDAAEVEFEPGVTVLVGRNATNRTSLLQSIAAGLGGSAGGLKGDSDEGDVTLTIDGDEYTRRFRRENGTTRVDGAPYTDDAATVDSFGCLLEANPARRAVERGDGRELRDVVMRPVDTAEIDARIAATRRELRDVETELEDVERRRPDPAELETRKRELQADLEAVESDLDDLRETVEAHETDREAAERAEAVVEELRETREEFERVRDRRRTQERARDSLAEERDGVAEELDAFELPEADFEEVEAELERLQRPKRELESTITSLLSIVEFNEELVEESDELPMGEDGDPYDELDPATQRVECWTCGTTVERGAIGDRLSDLRDVIDEKRAERDDLDDRIDELRSTRATIRDEQDRREALQDRLGGLEAELDDREERIEDLDAREAELRGQVDKLEAEAADADDPEDRLDDYRRLSELEYERGQLEEQLEAVERDLEESDRLADEREQLAEQREQLREELTSLRDRIEELERSAVETFNEEMATVLELLGYGDVERIWIERVEGDHDEGASFDLHVVRTTDDGAAYEDSVDHLSESEREVTGLVVALAGYLVHDVHETVPIVLLDSLEAIDAGRIAALVEYLADYAPYLLVALLPGDAAALPDTYDRIRLGG